MALTEVRWHGRGGQGAVTAAKVLAEVAMKTGKNVQAFPEYGPERTGAPLRAYNRISDSVLRLHSGVTNPSVIVVIDPSLLEAVDVTEGATQDAVFVINTNHCPADIKKMLKLEKHKVFTVNASQIALDTIGRPIPNTPMLGALAKATGIITLEGLLDDVKKSFGKKFSEQMINSNLEAVKRAYQEVSGE
ncbi:MAG: 2-oxoacid:acceptor oxidoreductase family protein [Deltaproteobacteria bacterium]|nr:2-oxoacid:acceptor oxidoreductase family protein [Deltaproteobacteria bacterium]